MNILAYIILAAVFGTFIFGMLRIAFTLFAICFVFALLQHGIGPILRDTVTIFQQLLHFFMGLLK